MTGDRKRVLVIDDSRMLVQAAERVLHKNNYEVFTASNGEEGLKKAREVRPDVIILDIVMPGLDGYQVSHHLKQDAATADIPIIFLSGQEGTGGGKGAESAGLREINLAFERGANDFLAKPVKAEDLLRSVKNALWFSEITSLRG